MDIESKLHHLTGLAREKSSERRRALLREVTDLFFEETPKDGSGAHQQFDAVLSTLAAQTAQDARAELSRRFADTAIAPRNLVMQLARDAIEVAAPILAQSGVLTEDDLIAIATEAGEEHRRAMTARQTLPERVSDAIVASGDDETLARLVANDGARLSRNAFETVARRAETSSVLQAPIVNRADTPADLLGDLMSVVETSLRDRIMKRFEALDPAIAEAAMAASHARLEARLADDKAISEARKFVATRRMRKELDGPLLVRLMREGERVKCCAALAELADVDHAAAQRALDHKSPDGLALICKAAEFDKALFVTLAILRRPGGGNLSADAQALGALYNSLTREDAERAMRFWRMRRDMQAA
ncbi:MAG: hypothetical protein HLUCCA04_10925 [Oceanicaulis sp. HLUCCA04]|nr:MAG: hypothetical protein HLUCCA04_10925 [Oceanicaulis sp. HLUCCA04]